MEENGGAGGGGGGPVMHWEELVGRPYWDATCASWQCREDDFREASRAVGGGGGGRLETACAP